MIYFDGEASRAGVAPYAIRLEKNIKILHVLKNNGRYSVWIILLPMLFVAVMILSSCNANESVDQLSGGYSYRWENDRNIYIYHKTYPNSGKLIPCTVVKYSFNERFIVAAQEPRDDCLIRRDDALKSGNRINYWIADNVSEQLLGPLSYDDYISKRGELSIPDDLELDLKD